MRKLFIRGLVFLIILVVLGAAVLGYLEYRKWNTPWGEEGQSFRIEIAEGKGARQIAALLVEKGVIENTTMFLILADLRGFADKLQAGEYQIKGTQTPCEVITMFAEGKHYYRSLLIPEGYTQVQIAEALEELEICTKEAFLEECQSRDVFPFVIVQAPGGANAACEGVLYPQTYFFEKNQETIRIFDRMVRYFNEKWDEILNEALAVKETGWWWEDKEAGPKKEVHNVVVLASIIEKEAKKDEDRAKIASVFVNRIKKNMALQADSTIHYILQDWSRSIQVKDKEIDSPYNTYKNKGLPPAAICNPGEASLRAALQPADTDYLYFITTKDGSARFSKTYEEHLKLKRELLRDN